MAFFLSAPTLVFDTIIIVFIQAYLLLSFIINLNFVDPTTTTTSTVPNRVDDSTTTLSGTDVTGEYEWFRFALKSIYIASLA